MTDRLSRRQALRGLMLGTAGAGLASSASAADTPSTSAPSAAAQPPGVCTLFPQAVEGPYYFDPQLVRADITDGRPGLALQLDLRVIESGPCTPITNARVDIWHADASGVYSGYDRQGDARDVSTKGQKYLRGTQMTDAKGSVIFQSIYPGWYPGRTPHIHVKVFLDKLTLVTGQIYFTDELSARIYRSHEPYSARPKPDTTNATDGIYKSGEREGGGTVFAVQEAPEKLIASLVIAVDRTGAAAKGGWGRGLRRVIGL